MLNFAKGVAPSSAVRVLSAAAVARSFRALPGSAGSRRQSLMTRVAVFSSGTRGFASSPRANQNRPEETVFTITRAHVLQAIFLETGNGAVQV